jgi:hypothetical protein
MRRPLGCLSGVGLIAALIALLIVGAAVAVTGGVLFSPGQLNAQGDGEIYGGVLSHSETRGNCAACHTPPWSREGMADRCAACHTAMADRTSHLARFHEILWADGSAQACRACHPEHRGATASLTELSVIDFPHERTGSSLAAHRATSTGAPFACADCHVDNLTAFAADTCDRCHAQIDPTYMTAHREDFGSRCLDCHDGVDRYSAFDHSRVAFRLEGAHETLRCGACHAAYTPADFAQAPANCVGCHLEDDAHQGGLGAGCAACHGSDDWRNATFDHARTRFPLTGGHSGVKCIACHAGARYEGTPVECIGCHREDDAHQGGLGEDCAACHAPDNWRNATFDHGRTRFPLTGSHREVKCDECHMVGRFEGTPAECFACHEEDDAHDGNFGRECAPCHTPDDWESVRFDHSATAFPLLGKHAQVPCEGCHDGGSLSDTPSRCVDCHQVDDAHGGQFGIDCAGCHTADDWKNATFDHARTAFPLTGAHQQVGCAQCHSGGRFKGTPVACVGCHQDPAFHRGLFENACDVCHTTSAWLPGRFDRPHTFPLIHGAAGPSPCRTCHAGALASYTCYGCHEHNPAEMQEEHAEEGISDIANCARCHPTGLEDEAERDED